MILPMEDAPRDGTRILLKYRVMHYRRPRWKDYPDLNLPQFRMISSYSEWFPSGEKWEECRWVSNKGQTGSDPHWEPWCGDERTISSQHIPPSRALGWMHVPEQE